MCTRLARARGRWRTSFGGVFVVITMILLVNLILLTNHANLPSSATIFLPLNQSIAMAFPSSQARDTVTYHIADSRHFYKDLLSLQTSPLALPTLLPGRAISVSRTDQDMLVDEQEIVAPDLYFDDQVVVHGIPRALDPDFGMSQSSSAATRAWPLPGSGP
ncbi:hypothetical protein GOP47_0002661 [Adiantum capillus-veneris]|uniref:FAS1 domain-containing protein n=1 Tax=Adiantum capillus-veneris TaxID=13818 RepID=A0A9D4VB00_ADICA|nr:hypothetical protein GOP47_0002661 [Adiantum capillus-veneris]